jgi:LPXTG-site transpeptidase (sortase) family protein
VRRSTLIIGAGTLILLVGAALTLGPWLEAYRWQTSPAAVEAERHAAAPQLVPVRPTPTRVPGNAAAPAVAVAQPTPPATSVPTSAAAAPRVPTPTPAQPFPDSVPAVPEPLTQQPVPTQTLATSDLRLSTVTFQFLDPPQPGATAVLSVAIENPTGVPSAPVSLDLPVAWLNGYRIEGVVPLPIDGRLTGERIDNTLRLTVDGPAAGDVLDLDVYVVTTDEVIDAPRLRAVDAQGREIGRAQPPTEAPDAEPGPVYSVDIPSLHLHAGVVQVDWEPPLFVVGQLRSSAHVMQGNTVLVGHLRGAAGYNVFDHLDKVSVGERIVANSRGKNYDFVVTQTQTLPKDDVSPTLPADSPRLTLMTCAGEFNPLTGEYADRLWVVAEPVDLVTTRAARRASATPTAPAPIAPPGGLGNTDADLARAFGGPAGETRHHLAVYQRDGVEHQAQLVAFASSAPPRATLVVEHARTGAPLSLDEAVRRSRALLPTDARPRSATVDGNQRFVVEYFASLALERTLPPEWFTERHAQPGELVVVYARRADGRITHILVGIGNDPSALLGLLELDP